MIFWYKLVQMVIFFILIFIGAGLSLVPVSTLYVLLTICYILVIVGAAYICTLIDEQIQRIRDERKNRD
ncbi:hypothetical protein ENKO_093 [Klebsiella phage fENko-Kae01]|nr:hypothetical protein 7t3_0253 [Salmonella phage 7t3]WNV47202.1 hypothetical protein [Klebsiella phage fENko-Kae01]